MKSIKDTDDFFNKFEQLIGLANLKLIHFNDSAREFDANHDNHAAIARGHITEGGKNIEGLQRIVAWAKKYDIPMILETPGEENYGCKEQLEVVNEWANVASTVSIKPAITIKRIPSRKSSIGVKNQKGSGVSSSNMDDMSDKSDSNEKSTSTGITIPKINIRNLVLRKI
jgi:hypothetical protein